MDTRSTSLVVRDRPIARWIIGAVLVIFAVLSPLTGVIGTDTVALGIRLALGLVGLGLILLSPVLTVTADRSTQTLTLHHKSLLTGSMRPIPFSQIDAIQLQMNHKLRQSSSSGSGPTYRTVVILQDGEVVPFHVFYSGGTMVKTNQIRQLREFIGVGGSEMGMSLLGTFREVTKVAQVELKAQQEALTGSQDEVHVTDEVRWQVQTLAFGGAPVTRWFSPDFRLADGFVYVVQVIEGQQPRAGGLLGGLSGMLYRPSLSVHGFQEADTPGIETAAVVDPVDPQMGRSFGVYTSLPETAQRILNPRVSFALADWARRYPLKQFHTHPVFSQLAVMFAPSGVYVASMGTMIPEAIEDMARLGVELLKAQESAPEALQR